MIARLFRLIHHKLNGISSDGWKPINLGDYSAPIYSKPINSSVIIDNNRSGWIKINVDRINGRFYPVADVGWIHEVDVEYSQQK